MTDDLLIHIHGFLCSHDAERVEQMKRYLVENNLPVEVLSPVVADNPEAAVAQLEAILAIEIPRRRRIGLVGHSLGGYYAAYLSKQYELPAVLVNPVVKGYEIMCEYYGERYNPHTNTTFEIGEADIACLFRIENNDEDSYSKLLVLQQYGDEILDAQEVLDYYPKAKKIAVSGGSHAFDGFDAYVERVYEFLFGGGPLVS